MSICSSIHNATVKLDGEKVDDQKAILLGVAIGTFVMCSVIIILEGPGRGLPLLVPPVIATGALAILSFWSRSKLS